MIPLQKRAIRSLVPRSANQFVVVIVLGLVAVATAWAQSTPALSLDTSRPLFAVLSGINACGFNDDLAASNPLRAEIRAEVSELAKTPTARESLSRLCRFYVDHMSPDPGRQLTQYVSLALNLNNDLAPRIAEADLPPDAIYVLGFVPLLQNFYTTAGLDKIWQKHHEQYQEVMEQYHKPVTDLLLATDFYLKQPLSSYIGRGFTVYVEPMSPPGQVNARNYGNDYFLVVSPNPTAMKLDQIRHTYLHYILDPLIAKRTVALARLRPMLTSVADAPISESYKEDIGLLVTESMIRAIEARQIKGSEQVKAESMERSMHEGFVFTHYFFDSLAAFEKGPTGFRDSYGDWLHDIDVGREMKRLANFKFASNASQEVVRPARELSLVDLAERQLANGNAEVAQKLARQALDESKGDPGRANFVLARAATSQGDMKGAQLYFESTLQKSNDPKLIAWSQIYLGRIADIQQNRESALRHYQAALAAGEKFPETKAAAERGIQQPYQPPAHEAPAHEQQDPK